MSQVVYKSWMHQPRSLCFEDRTRRRTFAMYRIIITTLLYGVVRTAPQDSNVTFVKIQPFITNDTSPQNLTRESIEEITVAIPSSITFENNENVSHVVYDDVTTELDQLETTTADLVDATTEGDVTTVQPTTKPKFKTQNPRFLSKLSHFKRANIINTVSTNSINSFSVSTKVDKPYKRKFKSRCRCEKIENCPKLQITVPRCPNEYFLCCF